LVSIDCALAALRFVISVQLTFPIAKLLGSAALALRS